MARRIYKSGSKWAFWRWVKSPLLEGYMDRLMLVHTPWGGVMFNWIRKPDRVHWLHDHPTNFVSYVLRGGYWETKEECNHLRSTNHYVAFGSPLKTPFVNGKSAHVNRMEGHQSVRHRIFWCAPDTLTLVFYGPRVREWGYHTPNGWVPWRTYGGTV